jgi:FkbH-like protein
MHKRQGQNMIGIESIILDAVRNTGKFDRVTHETPLRGNKSPLDSLAFVHLMAEINAQLKNHCGKDIDIWKPEYFLGKAENPYETVGSLIALAKILAGETQNLKCFEIYQNVNRTAKIIFTDLDGTLWDGIGGEGEVRWNYSLINLLRSYNDQGVLLVLLTKNYRDIVEKELNRIRPLAGRFLLERYSCTDKAAEIKQTCEKLNIRIEHAVFLDDDEHERDHVKYRLPEVWAPENHLDIGQIEHLEAVTDEDQRRTQMYREEFERESSRINSDSEADRLQWLSSLGMVLTVKMAETAEEIDRANELISRSNQFNFGKILPCKPDTYVFKLRDRFGDMGIIAVMNLYVTSNGRYVLHNFCVSCRVLGRHIEDAIWKWSESIGYSIADPIPSGKNMAALDFWKRDKINPTFIKVEYGQKNAA